VASPDGRPTCELVVETLKTAAGYPVRDGPTSPRPGTRPGRGRKGTFAPAPQRSPLARAAGNLPTLASGGEAVAHREDAWRTAAFAARLTSRRRPPCGWAHGPPAREPSREGGLRRRYARRPTGFMLGRRPRTKPLAPHRGPGASSTRLERWTGVPRGLQGSGVPPEPCGNGTLSPSNRARPVSSAEMRNHPRLPARVACVTARGPLHSHRPRAGRACLHRPRPDLGLQGTTWTAAVPSRQAENPWEGIV